MKRIRLTVTTDGDGAGSATSEVLNGLLRRLVYVKVDYADGVDIDITGQTSGTVYFSADDVNAAGAFHPRQPTHTVAGVLVETDDTTGVSVMSDFPVDERIVVAVASGGATKTGHFDIWVG